MKFSSVLGFVAGLAGLSTAVAAPYGGHHGDHGHGSSETVTIAAATILVEENTSNYYITFEAIELVEVVETSSSGYYKPRSNELATRQPWSYGSHNYGNHITIAEEIVLVEVVSQKKYKTVTAIAVAEYINIESRGLEARGHQYDHNHKHVIAVAVEEVIVISGHHYKIVEAASLQVYFQSGSSKREALPAPSGGHHGSHGSQTTITIAAEEEIFVNNNYYEIAVAIEVVVEIIN